MAAERLVKAVTGALRVLAFEHTIRINTGAAKSEKGLREPVRVIRCDYTERSGPQRVRDLLPAEEAEMLLQCRFADIRIGRAAVRTPVQQMPLAICNARSIASGGLVAANPRYQDRVGEICQMAYNPVHRGYYFAKMGRNEVLAFKCYDSIRDGRSRFTAHTAFEDPKSPADAPACEDIETRTPVFF